MRTVGLAGSYGKTTAAWLMRGLFEETGELTGMIGEQQLAILWPATLCLLCFGHAFSRLCD
jgi:hypothetical protein